MQTPLVAIPIRSFRDAKQRLADELDHPSRIDLATALATHTAQVVTESGTDPLIISSSPDVASWSEAHGYQRRAELPGGRLNGAAAVAVSSAGDRPWLVLHSDLPCLEPAELESAYEALTAGTVVLAPSYDGGTTAIGGYGDFPFAYGPGSFHRHLNARPLSHVIVSLGFLLDIDSPGDLQAARSHPRGAWLTAHTPDGN